MKMRLHLLALTCLFTMLYSNQTYSQSTRKKSLPAETNKIENTKQSDQKKQVSEEKKVIPEIDQKEELITTTFKANKLSFERMVNLKEKGLVIAQVIQEKGEYNVVFRHFDINLKLTKEVKKRQDEDNIIRDFAIACNTDSSKVYILKNYGEDEQLFTYEYDLKSQKINYYITKTPEYFKVKNVVIHDDKIYLNTEIRTKGRRMLSCCFLVRKNTGYSFYTKNQIWEINLKNNSVNVIPNLVEGTEYFGFYYDKSKEEFYTVALEKDRKDPYNVSNASFYKMKNNQLEKLYDIDYNPNPEYKLYNIDVFHKDNENKTAMFYFTESKKPIKRKTSISFSGSDYEDYDTKLLGIINVNSKGYTKELDIYPGSLVYNDEFNDGFSTSGKVAYVNSPSEIIVENIAGFKIKNNVEIINLKRQTDGFLIKTYKYLEFKGNVVTNGKREEDVNYYSWLKIDLSGKIIWKKDAKEKALDIFVHPLSFDPTTYIYGEQKDGLKYAIMKNDVIPNKLTSLKMNYDIKSNEQLFETSRINLFEWYDNNIAILVYQTNVLKSEIDRFKKLKEKAEYGSSKAELSLEDEKFSRNFFTITKAKINY